MNNAAYQKLLVKLNFVLSKAKYFNKLKCVFSGNFFFCVFRQLLSDQQSHIKITISFSRKQNYSFKLSGYRNVHFNFLKVKFIVI